MLYGYDPIHLCQYFFDIVIEITGFHLHIG